MNFVFHCNCIYIIQSLPDDEIQTGKNLLQDIILQTFRFQNMRAELINVSNRESLTEAFRKINAVCLDDEIIPYLHFEIHGSPEGFVLKNEDRIEWEVLRPELSVINYNVANNLFVSLATCYGARIFSSVDMLDRIPFVGFIGPYSEISTEEVEKDWGRYFEIMLSTKDFGKALISLNEYNKQVPYIFLTGEQIFDRFANAYLENFETEELKQAKVESMWRRLDLQFPHLRQRHTKQELDAFFNWFASNQKPFVAAMKDYFMMRTDEFPLFR